MSSVGFGSMAFHGTLQKWGQAMDELSMIWAAAALVFAVLEIDVGVKRTWLGPALVVYCAFFSVVYFYLDFAWFLGSYIALVLTLFAGSLRFCGKTQNRNVKLLLGVSAVLYAGGFLFLWLPDKLLCEKVQPYQFHALFVSALPPSPPPFFCTSNNINNNGAPPAPPPAAHYVHGWPLVLDPTRGAPFSRARVCSKTPGLQAAGACAARGGAAHRRVPGLGRGAREKRGDAGQHSRKG
jgi:hypothetical protein